MGQNRYSTVVYTCAGCGAEAVTIPVGPWRGSGTVMVPHAAGCPVMAQVADARLRAMQKAGQR